MGDCRDTYSKDLMASTHEEDREKRINKGSMKRTRTHLKLDDRSNPKAPRLKTLWRVKAPRSEDKQRVKTA